MCLEEVKKYATWDDQGMHFRDYTIQSPETEQEIRKHFWGFDEARTTTFDEFTLTYISEVWLVTFLEEGTKEFKEKI